MSRGKRFEPARRLFTTGLDKPHGRNRKSLRFVLDDFLTPPSHHRGRNTLRPTGDLGPLAYTAEVQLALPGERPLFVSSRRGVGEERGRRDTARGGVSSPLCRPWGRAAALRRGERGTTRVAVAWLPAVLVPVEAPDPGAGRGRLPGGCPGHARLQPLGQTARSATIPPRAAGARRGAPDTGLRGTDG